MGRDDKYVYLQAVGVWFVIFIQAADGCYIYTITYNVIYTVNRICQRIFIEYFSFAWRDWTKKAIKAYIKVLSHEKHG